MMELIYTDTLVSDVRGSDRLSGSDVITLSNQTMQLMQALL